MKRAASLALLTIYALVTFSCGSGSSNSMMNNGTKAPAASSPLATPPYFAVSGTSGHLEEVAAGTTGPSILDDMSAVAANTFTSLMVVGRETNGSLQSR